MEKLRKDDPERIGPYDVVARLGSGGMGVVFLGTKGVDRVAIKVVRNSFLDDPSLRTRFVREIETLQKVESPYVAKFLDSSVDGEIAWHAVEFVNGPTLKELIDSNGPMGEDAWLTFAGQLRRALDSVHREGVVHRDIKPSNIIMSETGPKVIDFGISQDNEATSITSTGAVAGSPAWLAPEQLTGEELSPASDLFSAGSVLMYAATGRSPWGQVTTTSVPVVYQKILSGNVDFSGLTASQHKLIMSLLDLKPEARSFDENPMPVTSPQTQLGPVLRSRAPKNYLGGNKAAPKGPSKPSMPLADTPRSTAAKSKHLKSETSEDQEGPTEAPTKPPKLVSRILSRRLRTVFITFGVIGIAVLVATPALWDGSLSQQDDSVVETRDSLSPDDSGAEPSNEPIVRSAVECDTFLCAFAIGFEESAEGVTAWVWSKDSSVYTVYDISLQITDGTWGDQFSNLGDCDGTVSLLPAGNWTSSNDGGTAWKRLCRNAILQPGKFANLSVSRGGEEWLKFTVKPERATEQPQSSWGAGWHQLDRVRKFEPSKTASPGPNEVFRNEIFSLTFAGGLDYGLGSQGLFNRYYSVSGDATRIIRQDCSDNAQPEWHSVQAKNPLESSWLTLGHASFASGCEDGNLRTYEISVDTLQSNFPGLPAVDFRFLNPHQFEATNPTTQWEAWNISFY